jgi:hypothetical protein
MADEAQRDDYLDGQMEVLHAGTLSHDCREIFEMCCEPYKSLGRISNASNCACTTYLARHQSLGDRKRNSQPVTGTGASAELIDNCPSYRSVRSSRQGASSDVNVQASPVNVAQDESNFLHLRSKRRHIRLNVVIHAQPSKELMEDRERSVCCWNTVSH